MLKIWLLVLLLIVLIAIVVYAAINQPYSFGDAGYILKWTLDEKFILIGEISVITFLVSVVFGLFGFKRWGFRETLRRGLSALVKLTGIFMLLLLVLYSLGGHGGFAGIVVVFLAIGSAYYAAILGPIILGVAFLGVVMGTFFAKIFNMSKMTK